MQTNLRKLRKERRLTQSELQAAVGVGRTLISKYETGERVPPVDVLVALADYYGVSVDYILRRTDKPELNQ